MSSSSSSESSDSIAAHTGTTIASSAAAIARTRSRYGLFSKPSSATFAIYIVGLIVKKLIELIAAFSSLVSARPRKVKPSSRCTFTFSSTAFCSLASLSPPFAFFELRKRAFSALSISASTNSVLITSISSAGSIVPATWMMFSSSKQRTTWPIASVSRMLAKNWLPRPSPLDAPFTKPAMSTNSILVVRTR